MGPTWVHPIDVRSPARDAGDPALRVRTDQRGVERNIQRDRRPDIGAYEVLESEFCVNSLADDVDAAPGDGRCLTARRECTLRAAIQETNALRGPNVVAICVPGTISLYRKGANEDAAAGGDLDITGDLTLYGYSLEETVIDGLRRDRIFDVGAGNSQAGVMITDLVVTGGHTDAGVGGGIVVGGRGSLRLWNAHVLNSTTNLAVLGGGGGGGVASLGTLDLQDVQLRENGALQPNSGGGGLYAEGVLRARWTRVERNSASEGGGIWASGFAEVYGSQIVDNGATSGGGIGNAHYLSVTESTVGSNKAATWGGGIWSRDAAVTRTTTLVTRSTLRDNDAGISTQAGAALHVTGLASRVELVNSTVSGNTGAPALLLAHGGRLTNVTIANNYAHLAGPDIELVNTILSGTNASWLPACSHPVISLGHNIEAGVQCTLTHPTDQQAIVSMLGLADNGGPTYGPAPWTHALTFDSIAVDSADSAYCPRTDQRGAPRLERCDVGAYEYGTSAEPLWYWWYDGWYTGRPN